METISGQLCANRECLGREYFVWEHLPGHWTWKCAKCHEHAEGYFPTEKAVLEDRVSVERATMDEFNADE